MKKSIAICSIFLATSACYASSNIPFSPYVDLTLSTHWDPQSQTLEPIDLTSISRTSKVSQFHLAFITDAGNCEAAWGGQSSYAVIKNWGLRTLEKMHDNNIQYAISLGGANGNDLSLYCNVDQLTSAYEKIITTYKPDGFDFDIENGTANLQRILQALQTVQANHSNLKLSFTLPVMPEGLTTEGKFIVSEAKRAGLIFNVNIMAMDFGPSYTDSMGNYAIDAATALFNFLITIYPEKSSTAIWQIIEVTPMIGVNDVNVEEFTLADAELLNQFANHHHLGGLSMWSINRDLTCADKWTNPNCSGDNLQTVPYEFSAALQK